MLLDEENWVVDRGNIDDDFTCLQFMLRLFYLMLIIVLNYFLFLWNSSLHILNDEISKKRYFKMKLIYWKRWFFHWTNVLDNYRRNSCWYSSHWSQSKHRISMFSLRGILDTMFFRLWNIFSALKKDTNDQMRFFHVFPMFSSICVHRFCNNKRDSRSFEANGPVQSTPK